MDRKCAVCGRELQNRRNKKFCSYKCAGLYRQAYSVCPVCGVKFRHSPSDVTTHTCGNKACMSKWRSMSQSGRKMTRANEAVRKLPHTGHFETHHQAEEWHLLSPDGKAYNFKNLHLWVENNTDLLPLSQRTGKMVNIRTFEREITRLKHTDSGAEKNAAARDNYYGWKILKMEES